MIHVLFHVFLLIYILNNFDLTLYLILNNMNNKKKEITLQQLEYKIYFNEKNKVKKNKIKERTLEQHFKITYSKKDDD